MGALSPYHLIIVLIVLFLLFGSSKLPGMARSLGRSMRIFKSEMSEMKNDSLSAPGGERTGQAEDHSPRSTQG